MQTVSRLISPAQKQHFIDHGYCVVEGLFSTAEIDEIEAFFEDFKINGPKVFDNETASAYEGTSGAFSYEDVDPSKQQLRAMHPHRHSRKAQDWMLHPRVGEVLEELLGRPALGAQTMYYFKPPGGKGQGMHQDNFYLLAKPATCIAAWTAIDAADVDNGCLWVVPGSSRGTILCPESGGEKWLNYGDTHITKFPREQKPVPVPVPRGATMFFSGNLIHGSGPNRTKDRFRRTFIGHYIDEASDQVAKFYHPVLNMAGEVVSNVATAAGGGPCGDGWAGAAH
jgi:phytanoyl-CoA hydroxylase